MSYETIELSRKGSSLVITFNRPERRNAMSVRMMNEIADAVIGCENDLDVRSVVLTGGPDVFSSGGDLTEAIEVKSVPEAKAYFGNWHRLCNTLEESAKPVIAAIEGFCFTGGCEVALACDLRIAGAGASFCITSSRIGTVAGAGGTQRLPRIVGKSNALEMLFAAEPIDVTEALRIGLINRAVEKGKALEVALELAATYAERAPLSLALVKRAVHRGLQMDLASGLDLETNIVTTIYGTEDKQEGISAFLEKRAPSFKGR